MSIYGADHIKMSIPAKAEYVGVARLTVSGIANRQGFTYEEIEDMKIAVAEACTNVVNHAYSEGGSIDISFLVYADKLEVIVADQGAGFNVMNVDQYLGPIESERPIMSLKEGGLGLFLIDTLMDKIDIYNESGVILKMTKFLNRNEVVNDEEGSSSQQAGRRENLPMD